MTETDEQELATLKRDLHEERSRSGDYLSTIRTLTSSLTSALDALEETRSDLDDWKKYGEQVAADYRALIPVTVDSVLTQDRTTIEGEREYSAKLMVALKHFGQHTDSGAPWGCSYDPSRWNDGPTPCDCGFHKLIGKDHDDS